MRRSGATRRDTRGPQIPSVRIAWEATAARSSLRHFLVLNFVSRFRFPYRGQIVKNLLVANVRRQKVVALLAAGAMISALPASAEWRHARGDSRNTSFERVNTSLAVKPRLIHTGPISPGVNPVIGVGGTVYVGTLTGELRAFRADGTPLWTKQLRAGTGGVYAAPVVGSDGSIFVVSMVPETKETKVNESFIHKFTPNGDYAWQWSFPKSKRHPFTDTGITTAPPSIWQWNGVEAVIVPVRTKDTTEDTVSLVAFSALGGGLMAHQIVRAHFRGDVTGEWEVPGFEEWLPHCLIGNIPACFMMFGSLGYVPFHEPIFEIPLNGAGIPLPGVAILPDARGGAPLVVAANGIHDKVVYAFSPQTGFQEQARVTNDQRSYVTTPVVDGNGTVLIGTPDGNLTRNGPQFRGTGRDPFPWVYDRRTHTLE